VFAVATENNKCCPTHLQIERPSSKPQTNTPKTKITCQKLQQQSHHQQNNVINNALFSFTHFNWKSLSIKLILFLDSTSRKTYLYHYTLVLKINYLATVSLCFLCSVVQRRDLLLQISHTT